MRSNKTTRKRIEQEYETYNKYYALFEGIKKEPFKKAKLILRVGNTVKEFPVEEKLKNFEYYVENQIEIWINPNNPDEFYIPVISETIKETNKFQRKIKKRIYLTFIGILVPVFILNGFLFRKEIKEVKDFLLGKPSSSKNQTYDFESLCYVHNGIHQVWELHAENKQDYKIKIKSPFAHIMLHEISEEVWGAYQTFDILKIDSNVWVIASDKNKAPVLNAYDIYTYEKVYTIDSLLAKMSITIEQIKKSSHPAFLLGYKHNKLDIYFNSRRAYNVLAFDTYDKKEHFFVLDSLKLYNSKEEFLSSHYLNDFTSGIFFLKPEDYYKNDNNVLYSVKHYDNNKYKLTPLKVIRDEACVFYQNDQLALLMIKPDNDPYRYQILAENHQGNTLYSISDVELFTKKYGLDCSSIKAVELNGKLIITLFNAGVIAININTGEEHWRYTYRKKLFDIKKKQEIL